MQFWACWICNINMATANASFHRNLVKPFLLDNDIALCVDHGKAEGIATIVS